MERAAERVASSDSEDGEVDGFCQSHFRGTFLEMTMQWGQFIVHGGVVVGAILLKVGAHRLIDSRWKSQVVGELNPGEPTQTSGEIVRVGDDGVAHLVRGSSKKGDARQVRNAVFTDCVFFSELVGLYTLLATSIILSFAGLDLVGVAYGVGGVISLIVALVFVDPGRACEYFAKRLLSRSNVHMALLVLLNTQPILRVIFSVELQH